jgi:hypothetical protein
MFGTTASTIAARTRSARGLSILQRRKTASRTRTTAPTKMRRSGRT